MLIPEASNRAMSTTIAEESDFEDSSTLRDVLGEVHEEEEEVIFYRTLFGHPPPHALG